MKKLRRVLAAFRAVTGQKNAEGLVSRLPRRRPNDENRNRCMMHNVSHHAACPRIALCRTGAPRSHDEKVGSNFIGSKQQPTGGTLNSHDRLD
jgi:hypothetical protein